MCKLNQGVVDNANGKEKRAKKKRVSSIEKVPNEPDLDYLNEASNLIKAGSGAESTDKSISERGRKKKFKKRKKHKANGENSNNVENVTPTQDTTSNEPNEQVLALNFQSVALKNKKAKKLKKNKKERVTVKSIDSPNRSSISNDADRKVICKNTKKLKLGQTSKPVTDTFACEKKHTVTTATKSIPATKNTPFPCDKSATSKINNFIDGKGQKKNKRAKKREVCDNKVSESSEDHFHDHPDGKKSKKQRNSSLHSKQQHSCVAARSHDEDGAGPPSDDLPKRKKKKERPEYTKQKGDGDQQGKNPNSEIPKAAENTNNTDGDEGLGQWRTAKFSNLAQQDKFVRLLGGAKSKKTGNSSLEGDESKSILSQLSGVWKPPSGRKLFTSQQNRDKKVFSSMALDSTESQKLATDLENQYNRTLEFNLQKKKEGNSAKGLGFQEDPAKGKTHYIDIHKVNSIALD